MTAEPIRFTCPVCGSFLGKTDGEHFEPPPCKCGWQMVMRKVKHPPRGAERVTGTPARL